jgi:hypothetical protein
MTSLPPPWVIDAIRGGRQDSRMGDAEEYGIVHYLVGDVIVTVERDEKEMILSWAAHESEAEARGVWAQMDRDRIEEERLAEELWEPPDSSG